ncbi:MAG TPA: VWA domain-containing protein [Terriglobia bacterium]|nr:VWA domain-containing protein [Terriglobia bacterium]
MSCNYARDRSTADWVAALAVAASLAVALAAPVIAKAQEGVTGESPVFAQPKKDEPPPDLKHQEEEAAKIRVQSPLVTTPVTVFDSAGQLVYDLGQKDFQILDNGVPQRIDRFDIATDPVAVVIIVEANDAVAPLLPHVRPVGSLFSSLLLGPQGEAAVIFYGDRVRVAQDFSNDSDQLAATLKGVTPEGSEARLNDALARATAMLEKRPKNERRVIVAFSDGFDRGSDTGKDDIIRRATSAEVTIYGLGFNPAEALLMQKPQDQQQSPLDANVAHPMPPGTVPTPTNSERVWSTPVPVVPILIATGQVIRSALASSLLEFYAGYTGGVFLSHWSKSALQDQLSRIASEIQSQYELAYAPDTLNQSGFHRIQVEVKRPGMKVRARAGYFYPSKE